MEFVRDGIPFAAAVGCGLNAGLFFIFSVCIMRALARLPAEHGMAAMQSINLVILNPLFFLVFFGTALTCLFVASTSFQRMDEPGEARLLAGALLYLLGAIATTVAANVPLNNALAREDPTTATGKDVWMTYLSRWTIWNHVRTVACTGATILMIMGIAARV